MQKFIFQGFIGDQVFPYLINQIDVFATIFQNLPELDIEEIIDVALTNELIDLYNQPTQLNMSFKTQESCCQTT